jgi:hypothetical protein
MFAKVIIAAKPNTEVGIGGTCRRENLTEGISSQFRLFGAGRVDALRFLAKMSRSLRNNE